MKKVLKWGGIALVVFIIIGVIANAGDSPETQSSNQSGTNNSTEQNQAEEVYQINESINSDDMELTVTSVSERDSVGGQFVNEEVSEGGTLVAVQWQYKNTSDEPIGSFSQPSIKLVDENGTEYDSDIGKSSTYATELDLNSKILSDLNPGITVRDASVFEISEEQYSQGQWFVVINADWGEYKVAIK